MTNCTQLIERCDLSIYLACYNEEEGIIPSIETIIATMKEVGCTYEIILVDDASEDHSVEVVQEYMRLHPGIPITLLLNEVNQGIGHNFVDAALLASGKYYRMICGDNVETKENFVKILKHLGEADILMSYHEDAKARSLSRRLVSRTYTLVVNAMSGHRLKYYNNLPVFRRDQVARWHPLSHGFGFQADMVTRLLDMGATYIEIPTIPLDRAGGRTKAFKFRNVCSVGHTLLEILTRRMSRTLFPHLSRNIHHGQRVIRYVSADTNHGSAATVFNGSVAAAPTSKLPIPVISQDCGEGPDRLQADARMPLAPPSHFLPVPTPETKYPPG